MDGVEVTGDDAEDRNTINGDGKSAVTTPGAAYS